MNKVLRILIFILAGFVFIFAVFTGIANYAYWTVPTADLPCRGCSGGAQMIHVNGFDLYYREVGVNGELPPVIVIHGGPGHSSDSFKQSLDFLGADRRVVYYDQRGSGHSQIKPDASLYTIDQLVEELEAVRRDVVKADKVVILGHSAGGALAQRYALAYPEHVDRLILVGSIAINNGIGGPALWDVFGPDFFTLGAGLPPHDPLAADAWLGDLNVKTAAPRLYDQADIGLIENSGYLSFATWREVSRSLEGYDYRAELGRLAVPALVIYGAADADATGKARATDLCATLPDCRLAGFDHSGHWPFLEEPERFAKAVNSFLDQ